MKIRPVVLVVTWGNGEPNRCIFTTFRCDRAKKGDETKNNNGWGIPLLTNYYKILSNILPLRLTPHTDDITGEHQCVVQRNESGMGKTFCILQILQRMGVQ
jgi:hypothetical protein